MHLAVMKKNLWLVVPAVDFPANYVSALSADYISKLGVS